MLTIKQGDAYPLPVTVKLNKEPISLIDIETVEFYIGDNIRKLYPRDVAINETDGMFYVPLEQEETFSLPADEVVKMDVRIKFTSGVVKGYREMIYIYVDDATSKEVL